MTGEKEAIARAIYERRNGHGCKPWSLLTKAHKEPYLGDAEAAQALFAPILAEKEVGDDPGRMSLRETHDALKMWTDRALAAEAALAEAEERCAKWADKVAAAIRAQGE